MTKISQLSAAAGLEGAEVLPVVQGGETKKASVNQLFTFVEDEATRAENSATAAAASETAVANSATTAAASAAAAEADADRSEAARDVAVAAGVQYPTEAAAVAGLADGAFGSYLDASGNPVWGQRTGSTMAPLPGPWIDADKIGAADGDTLAQKLARYPVYVETYWNASHADYTIAVNQALAVAAAQKRPIVLKALYDVSARIDLPAAGVVVIGQGRGTGFRGAVSGTSIILYGELLLGQVILKDFEVDGRFGGQLDSGLIQFAGSAAPYILCDNLYVHSGGTPSSGPAGVNGIAVATTGYPAGPKSRIVIRNCHIKSTTKAAYNISTYAEDIFIIGCAAESIAGNGSAPGCQINGGRRVIVDGLNVNGTEGAGLIVSTVGQTPPLSSRAVILNNILLQDCGQIEIVGGGYSSEGYGLFVSDANGSPAGSSSDASVVFGVIEVRNARQAGAVFSTGSGRVNGSMLVIDGATVGIICQNVSNVHIKARLTNVNSRALSGASVSGVNVNGSTNIKIEAEVWTRTGAAPDHLIFASGSASSGLDITIRNRGVALVGQPIAQSTPGYIRDSRLSVEGEVTLAAGANAFVGYIQLANGQTAGVTASCHASGAAETAQQWFSSCVRTTAGTAALIGSVAKPVDIRSAGIATGLFLGVDGNASAVQLFAAAGESTDFAYKYTAELS